MDARLIAAGLIEIEKPENPYDHTYGTVEIPWYGKTEKVHVIFERDEQDDLPTDRQIEAFSFFMSHREVFFYNLEDELFIYFNIARSESNLDKDTIDRLFPKLNCARELKNLMKPFTVMVSYYAGEDWSDYIGLLMECTWEIEHGLGVKIVDNKVIEIGIQEIVL